MAEKTEIKEKKQSLKSAAKPKEGASLYDPWRVLLYPSMSEKSIRMIESENKIVFVVRQGATKKDVKKAFENAFAVKVVGVRMLIDRDSKKKAFIRLAKSFLASDIATKLGVI